MAERHIWRGSPQRERRAVTGQLRCDRALRPVETGLPTRRAGSDIMASAEAGCRLRIGSASEPPTQPSADLDAAVRRPSAPTARDSKGRRAIGDDRHVAAMAGGRMRSTSAGAGRRCPAQRDSATAASIDLSRTLRRASQVNGAPTIVVATGAGLRYRQRHSEQAPGTAHALWRRRAFPARGGHAAASDGLPCGGRLSRPPIEASRRRSPIGRRSDGRRARSQLRRPPHGSPCTTDRDLDRTSLGVIEASAVRRSPAAASLILTRID